MRAMLETERRVTVCKAALEVAAVAGDASVLPALEAVKVRLGNEPSIVFAAEAACMALAGASARARRKRGAG